MASKSSAKVVNPGVFVARSRILVFGIVVLVLLILVIVLGALLGKARSELKAKGIILH